MQSALKRVCVSFPVLSISSLLSLVPRVGCVVTRPCLRQSPISKLQGMCTHLPTYLCGKHKYNSQINSNISCQKHKHNSHKVNSTVLQTGQRWVTGHKSCSFQLCKEREAWNVRLSPPKTPFPLIGAKRMLWSCWQQQGARVTFSRAYTDQLLQSSIRDQQRFQRRPHKILK